MCPISTKSGFINAFINTVGIVPIHIFREFFGEWIHGKRL
jgi:hypothetical protein